MNEYSPTRTPDTIKQQSVLLALGIAAHFLLLDSTLIYYRSPNEIYLFSGKNHNAPYRSE